MATCKDCIHYYVCNSKGANCREDIGFGSDVIFITESLKVEEQCDEFFPDVVRCKDCKYVDNGYIGHLYCRFFNSMPVSGMDYCKWGEQKVSTSKQEVPVKHGHWVSEYDCGYITPHCSECGETALTKEETSYDYVYSSYCPRCGAKLDKTE